MVNRREVTLADVAARAGVSVGTVSKVLNGRGQLSVETRQRVAGVAAELGLGVREAAPSASRGRSFLVGVLSTDAYGRFTLPILTGAEDAFGPGEVSMLLAESRGDPIREAHYVRTFLNQQVDGILVAGSSSDSRPSITGLLGVPTVYALSPSQNPDDVSVVPDDEAGAERAIGHLIGEKGRGIRTGLSMNHNSRLDIAAASAGLMRTAVSLAAHHAQHRHAFQKALIDQPIMQNVLADIAIEAEAVAQALCMQTEDFSRAYHAFANKQKPVFEGN